MNYERKIVSYYESDLVLNVKEPRSRNICHHDYFLTIVPEYNSYLNSMQMIMILVMIMACQYGTIGSLPTVLMV